MAIDLTKPVEVAEEVFWVGQFLENDIFQCHPYLIRNGKESILIDPGSRITFRETIRKIKYLVDLEDIRYIVCHHQDPDVTASLPELERVLPEGERFIVTHWRTYFLIKHYNLVTPFYLVDQHGYSLQAGDRRLEFILTPYMHYPGNIVTYDPLSKTLFSSDIFGGWVNNGWSLFAGEDYVGQMKKFHEIYMPCKEVVLYSVEKFRNLDIEVIAPQHGSVIRGRELVERAINALEEFEYGKMLEEQESVSLKEKLQRGYLISILEDMLYKDVFLSEVLGFVQKHLTSLLPVVSVTVIVPVGKVSYVFSKETGFYPKRKYSSEARREGHLIFSQKNIKVVYEVSEELKQEEVEFLKKISSFIFPIALRERKLLAFREREERLRTKVYRDSLTGLYRREFFEEYVTKEFYKAKRFGYPLSFLVIDIDNFKQINDRFGHLMGDKVLRVVGKIIRSMVRKSDVAVRFGGEEFVVVLPHATERNAVRVAEKIREAVERVEMDGVKPTVSVGVASAEWADSPKELLMLADKALYRAKRAGKNRVVSVSEI